MEKLLNIFSLSQVWLDLLDYVLVTSMRSAMLLTPDINLKLFH